MTLARLSNNWFPSTPSFFDRFFEGDLMDWNRNNFSSTNSTLPAVNVKENDNEFLIEVAAPGMTKNDFKIEYDNGRLTISSEHKDKKEEKDGEKVTRREEGILFITLPKREEIKPKPAKEIKIS